MFLRRIVKIEIYQNSTYPVMPLIMLNCPGLERAALSPIGQQRDGIRRPICLL